MKYAKPSLTFEEQADLLLKRGLTADRDELTQRLEAVSYYRLSGYLFPFRETASDRFVEGTTLQTIWDRYCFDRQLRLLLLDAIERIEVSVRTKLVYHFSHEHGPFGYCNEANLPKLNLNAYLEWRLSLEEEVRRSKETFKTHFREKYGDVHPSLPLWMLAELMSMGSLLTFYKGVAPSLKQRIAIEYGISDKLLLSWLTGLYTARNICAHHARLWNRSMGTAVLRPSPNKFPDWHKNHELPNNRCGILIMICRYMLRLISPSSKWNDRIENLMTEFPGIPLRDMGLPEKLTDNPIWTNK